MTDHPMLERVARAMHGSRKQVSTWDDELAAVCDIYLTDARAALTALLELTPDVVEAGRWPAEDDGPDACWSAMINHILKGAE